MQNFEALEQELKKSRNAEKLMNAARSEEGKKVAEMLDAAEVERATRGGDPDALKSILGKVLSTPEGQALAKKLRQAMGEK